MLRRPQPSDSEADLLSEQEHFLTSGAASSASVIRRPDKRRGQPGASEEEQTEENEANQKDVVIIKDLPDQLPSLTPAPPKKSRFKASRVTFEDEDAGVSLDRQDTHISAVLSKIVEKDTSCFPVSLPAFTGVAFPKVLHHSVKNSEERPSSTKAITSRFARQIAAQRLQEAKNVSDDSSNATVITQPGEANLPPDALMDTNYSEATGDQPSIQSSPRLVSGHGLGGPDNLTETMRIHRENQAKLQAMSQVEIVEEQKKLLSQLDPSLVEFVRSRKDQNVTSAAPSSKHFEEKNSEENPQLQSVSREASSTAVRFEQTQEVEMVEQEEEPVSPAAMTVEELPVKPRKEWIHMDKVESDKLEWMRDLPAPRKKNTKETMRVRFDFSGNLLSPTADLPTHLGLHHHGDEPERPGYSLQELFLLARSQVAQQRTLSLSTLANILAKARCGEYRDALEGSVIFTLLDAGLLFLLRFAVDDGVESVMSAAVHALKALLVCPEDEECLDITFSWFRGLACFPLLPSAHEEDEEDEEADETMKETPKEKEEKKSDFDVARQDVVKGLMKMKLLPRLRYILEVVRPSLRVVLDILAVLTRVARHSSPSATQVLDCPRLMETVISEFLPPSWSLSASRNSRSFYGHPLPDAMKLLRVLATSGRHACARLLNSLGVRELLSWLLSAEPSELLLEKAEFLCITTEAYRLWAVGAGYGQACKLYLDLYPAIVKSLHTAHQRLHPADALLPQRLQRISASISLLTNVTHTAGWHQELQASMMSDEEEHTPPPAPVCWGHVIGLKELLLGHLKGSIKNLDDLVQRDSGLALIPAYLIYLQAYYHQLCRQKSFKPVETLQELELLTADVLLPLLGHLAVQNLMKNLKSSSVLCTVQLGQTGPETTASLLGLACSGWRDRPGMVVPSSPFPLLTALTLLLETITRIHKGLIRKFSSLLLSESVIGYLRAICQVTPSLSRTTAWLQRHEHHLLYLLLRLAHTLIPVEPEVATHASLYHQVALVLLPWLLPGSEHIAYELLSTCVFSKNFILEGQSGGPEALELGQLRLHEDPQRHASPSHQNVGALLREACVQLPSIRACFLSHLAHLEPSVVSSGNALLGRCPWVNAHLLPELTGPALPSDWPFLPLVSLYERAEVCDGGGLAVEELPPGTMATITHCLQWLLLLEVWREESLKVVSPVAKFARLSCVFLCSSDLFLERPVQKLMWGLFRLLTSGSRLDSLDLSLPPPGVASFQDLYVALLTQYEAVSFGDRLFGCWVLLPLQRRYSVTLRLIVFGEHVGILRSLGVTFDQLSIPMERFTSPPEDSLPLLRLYFRSLLTGILKSSWCPILYVVALSHVNSFIFSQDAAAQEVEAARHSMLRKIFYLSDEVLRSHLLLFRLPRQNAQLGFDTYEELPPIRVKRLERVLSGHDGKED